VLLLATTVRSSAHIPLGMSDRNNLITLCNIRLTTLNCYGWCAGSESDTSCSDCDEKKKNNGVTEHLKKVIGDCECDSLMHSKYEVKYELASLAYQCFSCTNVVCEGHMT